jgi:UDP-N-acetylmuramyl pentapeptide synthase
MNKEHQTVRRALTLGDIVAWSRGVTALGREARSARVATVWNDSRKVTKGDVFVALKSERDDGHRFVNAGRDRGPENARGMCAARRP